MFETVDRPQSPVLRILVLTVAVLTSPLWLGAVLLVTAMMLGLELIYILVVYLLVWTYWIGVSRRRVLFVYSNSPNWKDYIESQIIPRLPEGSVVLNWSERRRWRRFSLPVRLFYAFAGTREFNPIGLVFERWRLVEAYRFWRPLCDAKHGRRGALEHLETQFLRHVA